MLIVLAGCAFVAEEGERRGDERRDYWLRVKGNIGILIFYFLYRFCSKIDAMIQGNI